MKRKIIRIVWLFGALVGALFVALPAFAFDPAAKFEATRDPAADVTAAIAQAKKEKKRVMVDVGGEWCPWCHILDRFVGRNDDVRKLVDDNYVWVKVNWSPENKNEGFLAKYPKVAGYPHLFVLDGNGKLVQSQNTGDLEAGKDYDKAKFVGFLNEFKSTR